jgi:hypothetical protein
MISSQHATTGAHTQAQAQPCRALVANHLVHLRQATALPTLTRVLIVVLHVVGTPTPAENHYRHLHVRTTAMQTISLFSSRLVSSIKNGSWEYGQGGSVLSGS